MNSGKIIPQDLQVSLVCEDDSLEGTCCINRALGQQAG